MRKIIIILALLLLPIAAHAQQKIFVPTCGGVNDTVAFTNIIATIGSNQGTIQLPYKLASRCAVNSLTIPSNVTLDNSNGTGLKVNSGKVLTVNGGRVNPAGKTMFFGPGTWALNGDAYAYQNETGEYTAPLCLGVDDTAILNTAISSGKPLIIFYGVTCATNNITFSTGLKIIQGGLLKPLTGQTATITGPLDAGPYQIFTNALLTEGTVSFTGNTTASPWIRQIWWGTGATILPYVNARTSVSATLISPRVAIEAPLDITKAATFTVQPGGGAAVSSSGEVALQGTFSRASGTTKFLKGISTIAQATGTLALSGALSCPGDATDPLCLNRLVGVEALALVDDDAQVPWAMGMVSIVGAFNSATAAPNVAALYADVSLANTAVNAYGIVITASNTASATNAYGVKINGVASTGNPFGFYSTGTWPNFFGGPLQLGGSASGKVTVQTAAAAGTWSLTLPTTAGTASEVLSTDGSGVASWAAPGLLSTTAAVNMNTATATTLYTCPTGKSCVIREVVVRNASTSLTTASYSFGWTSAAYTDVIANAAHTELTGATLLTILTAKAGSTLGTSTGTFKVLMNTLQGGAATTTIDVFGYVF